MSDHIPGVTKMIGDTPRTDQQNDDLLNSDSYTSWLEISGFARQLERELTAAHERIKRLEEELERTKQDRNAIAKNTREPLLLKLDHAAERIKRLEDIIEKASEHFRRAGPNAFTAYEMADVLKEAKP